MYIEELKFTPDEMEMPDIPFEELMFEDVPSINALFRTTPTAVSQALTEGQSSYTQSVTIRLPRWLLAALKKEATERGEKYQTYINLILSQHAAS